jgi:hypothetical protein
VPVEGQALRARTALRPRDKAFLAALAAAAVIASGVGAYLHFSRESSVAPCVTVTIPSTMGGATIRKCGADAVRFCRAGAAVDSNVAAACRRQGFGV